MEDKRRIGERNSESPDCGDEEMKKFECPDLLYIAQCLASYEDSLEKMYEHFHSLFDWIESQDEDKESIIAPVLIILKLICDEIYRVKKKVYNLREEFPSMPMPEWDKFNERWERFLETMDDLKLNNE